MTAVTILVLALETAISAAQPAAASAPLPAAVPPVNNVAAAPEARAAPLDAHAIDPRIRVVPYRPDSVTEIKAVLGYQLMIEFAPDERIENVAIGDSLGWQITPNRKANLLFVKPMDKVPVTNMTVVTNLRTYLFEMIPDATPTRRGDRNIVYALQFSYPPEKAENTASDAPPPPPPPPQVVNSAYSYTGSTATLPMRIFDDGHATYFQFRDGEDYPAIFTTDGDKGEAIVNSSIRGGYVVVDSVARGFTLRRGADVTRIFNDGFREPQPGPLSPTPRRVACGNCIASCWICL
jgi:type IV secretion system protein VirB9